MSKLKKSGRSAGVQLPELAAADDASWAGLDGGALWQHAQDAEASFDYEGARAAYREATRRSGGREQREHFAAYAEFLVERYGQFPEVAAWLDDPRFDPAAADGDAATRKLASLVGRAASEAGHARAANLDEALAALGDAAALGRSAERLIASGESAAALALLEAHRGQLAALSLPARLLGTLRQANESAADQALLAAADALQARDLASLDRALEAARAQHAATASFRATIARRDGLALILEAEALRAAIEAALDADDLSAALASAEALAGHSQGSAGDVRTRDALAAKVGREAQSAQIAAALAAQGDERSRCLIALLGVESPALPEALQAEWRLLRLAATVVAARKLTEVLPGLRRLAVLDDAIRRGDSAAAIDALDGLPVSFLALEPARRAQQLRDDARRKLATARENAVIAGASEALSAGDIDGARAQLDAAGDLHHVDARPLRAQIDDAMLRRRQRGGLVVELDRACHDGRLFAARRTLAALATIDDEGLAIANARRDAIEARAAVELRATPKPPFGLTIGDGPIAVGYGGGRLVVVSQRLWLAVNVETRGVAPFELPEAWTIDHQLPPRIGERLGRTRLIGTSAGRLVAYEAEQGGRPEIVQGRPLSELTRGDVDILSAGLEPDADVLALLARPRGESIAHLVRIDAETFEVISSMRHKPPLASIATISNDPEGLLAATTPEARRKRAFAIARYDFEGKASAQFDQETLGEQLAGFRSAVAWPEESRLYASYSSFDYFATDRVNASPSLLVLRDNRIVFASNELQRRFAPTASVVIDHAWALDTASGRLWFATLPREGVGHGEASLLGVDARTLRPAPATALAGVERVLHIAALPEGAVAFCRLAGGGHGIARVRSDDGDDKLTIDRLPI